MNYMKEFRLQQNIYFTVLHIEFDFAIVISGFQSLCTSHVTYYNEKMSIPTLHIYGETDQIIPTG